MSDWPIVALGDLVEEITVGFVGSMTHEYVESGVPFFRSKNISEYEIDWNDIRYISDKFHKKLKKSTLRPGDVAIVRTGKPGTTCVIPETITEANCSDIVIVRVDDEKLSAHYLSYFMNSIANDQVSSHLVGAVQQHFNVGSAKKIEIPLPSRDEQEKIVKVLKDLDDKGKLNRQANLTLEHIAQAIFKSWFVDFEPTRAKIAAKQTGQDPERAAMAAISGLSITDAAGALDELDQLSPEQQEQLQTTAALFPDALVASELGEIPMGWAEKTLAEKMTPRKGKNITKKTITPGDVPVVAGGLTPAYHHNTHNVTAPVITISASGANAGFINIYHQNIWASDCSFVNKQEFDFIYTAYLFFKSRQDEITHMQQGAAQPHVYPKDLVRLILADPPESIWRLAEELIEPFFERIKNNTNENSNLEELRDSLLPRLLSGDLDVKEVA